MSVSSTSKTMVRTLNVIRLMASFQQRQVRPDAAAPAPALKHAACIVSSCQSNQDQNQFTSSESLIGCDDLSVEQCQLVFSMAVWLWRKHTSTAQQMHLHMPISAMPHTCLSAPYVTTSAIRCVLPSVLPAGVPQHVTEGVLQQAHKWFALPVSQMPQSPAVLACQHHIPA
jgi:hypothetical protein